MAPELLKGEPNFFPVDVWSFGVLLFFLASSKLPFPVLKGDLTAGNSELAHKLIIKFELNFGGKEWRDFSESFKGLLEGMLEKNPYDRLTADDILAHSWLASESYEQS